MELFIVAECEIIEEAMRQIFFPYCLLPRGGIFVNMQLVDGFFQILTVSDNHPFIESFRYKPRFGEVRISILIFNLLLEPNEKNNRYSIIY